MLNTKNHGCRFSMWSISLIVIFTFLLSGCTNSSSSTTSLTSSVVDTSVSVSSSNSSSLPINSDEALIFTPVKAHTPADKMEDSELIAMFDTLYKNGCAAGFDWPSGTGGIECNQNGVVAPAWVKVTNVASLADLRLNYEAVFSKKLLNCSIYPEFIDGEEPTFKEIDGELNIHLGGGGGIGASPDLESAIVASKTADSVWIDTKIYAPENVLVTTFTHILVVQNGYWVLDTFYPFLQGIIS